MSTEPYKPANHGQRKFKDDLFKKQQEKRKKEFKEIGLDENGAGNYPEHMKSGKQGA